MAEAVMSIAFLVFELVTLLRAIWFMVCPPNYPGELRYKWFMADYDMWIGAYLKRGPTSKDKIAYWFPFPFVGVKIWRQHGN